MSRVADGGTGSVDLGKFNTVSPVRSLVIAFACGLLVASSAIAGQWLFNVRLAFPRPHGIGLVGPIISFIVTVVLVSIIQLRAQQRRRARLARAQVVADCNHEIRNALQSMIGLNYPRESVDQIEAAVRRIDGALRDLLPHVEDDEGPSGEWDVRQGHLTSKR